KIEDCAKEDGIAPQQYVDKVAGEIRGIWDMMNSSYEKFIRTTDDYHKEAVQKIFKKLYDQGDIYKNEYEGHYCVPCESFFTETQLVDGCCPDCGRPVKKAKEEAYFFKMSKYQDRLMKHIEENPDFIKPESRKREMINNFLKPGLQDLCVSRTSFKWGIPVTFDDNHVIYVWVDALSNYITALGYNPDGSSELYNKYWPANVHIIGKDILRFHTIYWPIILMALGLPLPKQVFGHGWLLFGQDKMSKSKGNVIYADDLVNTFGVDAVRYYLLSEMPYGQDGNITYENLITKYNSDLANTIGNLVNRTVAMINKYFDGTLSAPDVKGGFDDDLIKTAKESVAKYTKLMNEFRLSDACDAILDLARRSNKYIDETAPWVLAKDEANHPRLSTVLYNLAEAIRFIAVMLTPIMPDTSKAILSQINTDLDGFDTLSTFGKIPAGTKVGTATPLFSRIDEKEFMAKFAEKEEAKPAPQKAEKSEKVEGIASAISIDDFAKVELRSAEILECEPVPKSKKLLRIILDDGIGKRQVVSGISGYYAPADLIGKKVCVVANLKPAKLCGVESNGMILASDCGDSVRVIFLDSDIPNGSKIR
ncbi:MAG: methionine--tRNA ligase, partial [Oscillospiraceae bacterium]|nr:methionine--tRNA ligase [Oscillospiraceae bacterium]